MAGREIFEVPDFALQSGEALPTARLVYRTLGALSPAKDNVVVIPSWYSGTDREAEFCMVGTDRAIDPTRHFVVMTNLLSGGVSSSPSNTPSPFEAARFPRVTLHDNVTLQHKLLTQTFGVERIKLVAGWSMGGCQAYQWGAQYPDMVEAIAPLCCSARTGHFNKIFLLSLRRALELDPAFEDGYYTRPPVRGLRAFATIYAGWGFSEPFYRTEAFRQFGATTAAEFSQRFWEPAFLHHDANDLLALLRTWEDGDISAGVGVRRRPGPRPGRNQGARHRHARRIRQLFSARRQPGRSRADAQRRVPPDPIDLGPHDVVESAGSSVYRCRAARTSLSTHNRISVILSAEAINILVASADNSAPSANRSCQKGISSTSTTYTSQRAHDAIPAQSR